jgi:fumarate reductase subunit D
VRLFFLLVIVGAFFHGAHRFKYMLHEAGARNHETGLGVVLYGLAILGSLGALYYAVKGWLI